MNTQRKIGIVAAALVAALAWTACQKSQDAAEQAKEKAQSVGDKLAQAADHAADKVQRATENAADSLAAHRGRLQHRLQRRLDRLDGELQELEQKVKGLSGDAKASGQKAITDLQGRRADVAKRLAELKNQSGDAWNDLAQGVRQAMADLEAAAKDAKSRFK